MSVLNDERKLLAEDLEALAGGFFQYEWMLWTGLELNFGPCPRKTALVYDGMI